MKIGIRAKLVLLLFLLTAIAIIVISGQAYKVALKDMSNNAKSNTRIYAKNISRLIEERFQSLKEKVLFAVINENIINHGSKLIFERTPEVLAVFEYYFNSRNSKANKEKILLNPSYKKKYSLSEKTFSNIEKNINFKLTLKDNEFISVAKLAKPISEIILYAFPIKISGSGGIKVFVAAVIPDVILTAISSGRSKYINYLIDSTGRILAHPDTKELDKNISRLAFIKEAFQNEMFLEQTKEYVDENKVPVIGSFFRLKRSNIGIVSKIPQKDAYAEAEKLKLILGVTSILVFFVSLILSLFMARSLSEPILKLSKITSEIAKGNFLVKIDIPSKDEIGDLANNFIHMGKELYKRESELKDAQNALVQSEKMAAFGQIGAGIAHEVKNPLTGILGHAQLAKQKIEKHEKPEGVINSLQIIEKETTRCKTIIENLMKFARQEKTSGHADFKEEDPAAILQSAVDLVDHQLSIGGIKICRQIPVTCPKIMAGFGQLEQVLMNLMLNAQHAMEDAPEKDLYVRLIKSPIDGFVRFEVEDTGHGMNEEIRKRIFEPFFTTKPAGKGTGLGLSVSYGIIKEHKGILSVDSTEGIGTKFMVDLPLLDPNADINEIMNAVESCKLPDSSTVPPILTRQDNLPPPVQKIPSKGGYRGEDPEMKIKYLPTAPQYKDKNSNISIDRPSVLKEKADPKNNMDRDQFKITRPKRNKE